MTGVILPRHFVEKPWGRTDLPAEFGAKDRRIGEVWYDTAPEQLPVLVKWLFTSQRLSIQVHPNDAQAQDRGLASGKEECWIITSTEEGASLGIGTKQALTKAELREASLSGEIEQLMDWKPVSAGDWFFIPAGTVHAIGAGVTLVEVQQNADVTYRLYDYGRPRELHLDDGVAVSQAQPYDAAHGRFGNQPTDRPFVTGPNFTITRLIGPYEKISSNPGTSLLVPTSGKVGNQNSIAARGQVLAIETGDQILLERDSDCLLVEILD